MYSHVMSFVAIYMADTMAAFPAAGNNQAVYNKAIDFIYIHIWAVFPSLQESPWSYLGGFFNKADKNTTNNNNEPLINVLFISEWALNASQ